jgi:bla regulator protein blaR1
VTLLLIAYAVVIGAAIAAAGVMLEAVAAARRWPRRWIWAASLAGSLALGLGLPWFQRAPDPTSRLASPVTPDLDSFNQVQGGGLSLISGPEVHEVAIRLEPVGRGIWATGSGAVLLIYSLGQVRLHRHRRKWRTADLQGVPVLMADDVGPAVLGVWTPRIVVPEWALRLGPGAVALMLSHEQEHQRARDPLLIHLAGLAIVAMPWSPASWWMFSRLRGALELDCDARVLGSHTAPDDAAEYGRLLLNVATHRTTRSAGFAPGMLNHSSSLTRRITAMCANASRCSGRRVGVRLAAAVVLIAATSMLPVPHLRAQESSLPAEPTVYESGNGVSWPKVIKLVQPKYTRKAMQEKIVGTVSLSAVLQTSGKPDHIEVTKSLDSVHGLDRAAVEALARSRFEPAEKDGKPVPVRIVVEMEFRLH